MPEPGRTSLVELLDLEPIEVNVFRGRGRQGTSTRTFGGQVAAQALLAAGRTVPEDRPVHSLHAYFLRPGHSAEPIVYLTDRIRDGRSFTTRRVVAVQDGEPIFHLSASFHRGEPGLAHQVPRMAAPDPEALRPLDEWFADPAAAALRERYAEFRRHPLEVRFVGEPPLLSRRAVPDGRQQVWMRTIERLPDHPLVHVAAVTYASDLYLLGAVLAAHGSAFGRPEVSGASLDHAMWFHAPFRADAWLFYDQSSPWAGHGRGLAAGHIFDRDGVLVASVVQEGLLRITGDGGG